QSWHELPYDTHHDYIAVFEDDMEVSQHYYEGLSIVHSQHMLSNSRVTGFCLHPNDWEVSLRPECSEREYSSIFYESPEPCNWGPVWKQRERRAYIDWVFKMKSEGRLPYVEEFPQNYNQYLDEGKDVQSSWVWRYYMDFGKLQLKYSFVKCHASRADDLFLAINHKERGEHFTKKYDLDTSPKLLQFEMRDFLSALGEKQGLKAQPFTSYESSIL
ncbi:hypothetical protein N9F40_01400, partial [bacterium]|nr:hypothetical protein [bacterium]